jgi:sugar/nucleoside kinase (ribokinase family)
MLESTSAVVAGHLCLDVIPDLSGSPHSSFETLFVPGHLTNVGEATFSTGGAVSNTGIVLHKLGVQTQLMGKVGADLFGQAIRQIVAAHGQRLAEGMIVDEKTSSSYTIIINPPSVDRIFLHCPGANDTFCADDVRYELVAGARLFHFGYPPLMRLMYENAGSELIEIFRRAKATGVTTSLDMSLPDLSSPAGHTDWVNILRSTLPYVDIFMPSIEEILFMLRRETYAELCQAASETNLLPWVTPELLSDLGQELLDLGAKIVGLKLGDQGLYLRTGSRTALEAMGHASPSDPAAWANRELWAPCFQVNMVGTTGAGDATIAGFMSALLRGMSPEATLTAAVAVGACNVEAADALGGIRSWEETLARIKSGWPRRALVLRVPGWRFDESHQLWIGPLDTRAMTSS